MTAATTRKHNEKAPDFKRGAARSGIPSRIVLELLEPTGYATMEPGSHPPSTIDQEYGFPSD